MIVKKKAKAISVQQKFWKEYNSLDNQNLIVNFIKANQVKLAKCFNEGTHSFWLGDVQSQKTVLKQELLSSLMENDLIDIGQLTTTAMTDALTQLNDRVETKFSLKGYSVFGDDNLPKVLQKNSIVVTMKMPKRIERCVNAYESTGLMRSSTAQDDLRICNLIDEGEEFVEELADPKHNIKKMADTEQKMYDLMQLADAKGVESVHNGYVSATLDSAIQVHFLRSDRLFNHQIFEMPTRSTYIGHNKGLNYHTILQKDNNFIGGSFKPRAKSSVNMKPIADFINNKIAQSEYGAPVITNLVYGDKKVAHQKTAKWLDREFTKLGKDVVIYDREEFPNWNNNPDIVILIHNGETQGKKKDSPSLVSKLRHLAIHYGKSIESVIVIAERMANKSITIDVADYENMYDPNHAYFGWYCDTTVYYGTRDQNIERVIQYSRCCGDRPKFKAHDFVCINDVKFNIEGYWKTRNSLLGRIKEVGYIDKHDLYDDHLHANRKRAKGTVHKLIVSDAVNSKGRQCNEAQRNDAIRNGFIGRDHFHRLSNAEFNKVANNKDEAVNLVLEKGLLPTIGRVFNIAPPVIRFNKFDNVENNWQSQDSITQNMQAANVGTKQADWIITIAKDQNGPFLYAFNWKGFQPPRAPHVRYVIRSVPDGNGGWYITFPYSLEKAFTVYDRKLSFSMSN